MRLFLRFLVAFLAIKFTFCYSKSYEYFKVYSVTCESRSDVESLKFLEQNPLVDFWSLPGVNKTSNILVDPSFQLEFEEFLSYENFNYEILIENVGKLVDPSIFVSFRIFNLKASKLFSTFFPPLTSIQFRTIKSHTRNKLKFHFQDGNFTDTVVRDFSHYWTLPEVNLEKRVKMKSYFSMRDFPFFFVSPASMGHDAVSCVTY